jgi:hypothetical protein
VTGPIIPTGDRLWESFRKLVGLLVAPTRFYGRYEYNCTSADLSTISGTPTDDSLGLPDLNDVPLTSDSIAEYTPPTGEPFHVQFLNGDPARPICVWTSGTATVVNVMGGANPVARQGDQVNSYLPPTVELSCTSEVAPYSFVAIATISNPISGAIVQGSPTANAP